MIRRATASDIEQLVALGACLHAESPRHSRLTYSHAKVRTMLEQMLARPMLALVLVAETAGVIEGAALAHIDPPWYSEDLVAQEISVYVIPRKRGGLTAARLIVHLDAWAKAMGARLLQAGTTTGLKAYRTVELYEHLGFERAAIGVERAYH